MKLLAPPSQYLALLHNHISICTQDFESSKCSSTQHRVAGFLRNVVLITERPKDSPGYQYQCIVHPYVQGVFNVPALVPCTSPPSPFSVNNTSTFSITATSQPPSHLTWTTLMLSTSQCFVMLSMSQFLMERSISQFLMKLSISQIFFLKLICLWASVSCCCLRASF